MQLKNLIWICIGNQEKSTVGKPLIIPWPAPTISLRQALARLVIGATELSMASLPR
jgi:hypothetical protein